MPLLQQITTPDRVKNNLYIISNLLNLQPETIEDQQMLDLFADSQSRIQTMALIHEQLYQSEDLGAKTGANSWQTVESNPELRQK